MKGSTLILSKSIESRKQKALEILKTDLEFVNIENSPDILFIEPLENKNSVGIAQIKELVKYITQRPFKHTYKAVLILEAHKITEQGQNALLKILEETPSYASIILGAESKKEILDTVISRCRIIRANYEKKAQNNEAEIQLISDLLKINYGSRVEWAEEKGKEPKEDIIELLEKFIEQERESMLATKEVKHANNIEKIQEVIENLTTTNVNTKLSLEYLVLQLK